VLEDIESRPASGSASVTPGDRRRRDRAPSAEALLEVRGPLGRGIAEVG
jgi:hypothetical protein